MSILNKVLFYLLIINSSSNSIFSIFEKNKEDKQKCDYAGRIGSATIEKCTAVTPTFKGPNSNESKCCFLTFKIDPFKTFKLYFGKNWKKQYMKLHNLNEKQAEDKINHTYGSAGETTMCMFLTKNFKNAGLYSITNSLPIFDGKIKYNCGEGEEIFDKEKYNPLNEEEKMNKDLVECLFEKEENSCINKASKLLSNNSQCCWCERMTIHDNKLYTDVSVSECVGFPIKEFRNELEEIVKKKKEEKYSMKCTCSDKNGKHVKVNLDSFNDKIDITNLN